MVEPFEQKMRRGGGAAIEEVSRFFMKTDPVHITMNKIAQRLDEVGVPYAVVGGMALVAHGYDRSTTDVDILLTREGLAAAHRELEGLGYTPPFGGSKNLRDVETGVRIEFLLTGGYPGDGKPSDVSFPDPAAVSTVIDGIRYVRLDKLIELKLASGLTNSQRIKDIADVQELIKLTRPPRAIGDRLALSVRDKYFELWDGAEAARQSEV